MKKSIYIITLVLFVNSLYSQVLYTENFNSYTTGNVGTDFTGTTPGKGGWLTESVPQSNNLFTITSETNKGNVLTLSNNTVVGNNVSIIAKKNGLESLIDQRTPGNNVLKFELDYYTGGVQQQINGAGQHIIIGDNATGDIRLVNKRLISYLFNRQVDQMAVHGKDLSKNIKLDKNNNNNTIPYNTWITLIVYLDYNNKKAYFETPYFNTIAVGDFLKTSTSSNLIEDFKPTTLAFIFTTNSTTAVDNNKYDNIKITALKSVPSYVLSAENFLADKFNLYPNPATSVVNISNAENMQIQQITVYDIAGKEIKKQTYTNENQIQLNVENLASGTYMLHLQTNEGLAVKKLVKK